MKSRITIITATVIIIIAGAASAGTWVGDVNPTYVVDVQHHSSGTSGEYVMSKVEGAAQCDYLRFTRRGSTPAAHSDAELRGIESVLLTALTTGLPVRAKVYTEQAGICEAYIVRVYRP